jgi:hypothetical protein
MQSYIAVAGRLAAAILSMLLVIAPATAAQITEPTHGTTLVYDEAEWSASLEDDQNIKLVCKTAACGGTGALCMMILEPAKRKSTPQALLGYFGTDVTKLLLEKLQDAGHYPVLADELAIHMVADRITGLSSIRHEETGQTLRTWLAQVVVPFGVAVLVCVCPEDKYATVNPQWLALVQAMVVPEK